MAEELIGYYSDLRQPIIPIRSVGAELPDSDSIPFLVDTGVNADLIVPLGLAKRLNWQISSAVTDVEMADGSESSAFYAYPYIRWHGRLKQCTALVLSPRVQNSQKSKQSSRQAFEGFLGMGLLQGTVIELASSVVRITKGAA